MYSNEQEKSTQSWKKPTDSLGHSAQPANDTTEISEDALENITGGVGPTPHPTIPNAYSYPSKGPQSQMPTATLITNNPSLPLHAEVMGQQYHGTVWQHAAFQRPDGQVEHHYYPIDLTGVQPPRKRQRIG
jgi:hypothetical protein